MAIIVGGCRLDIGSGDNGQVLGRVFPVPSRRLRVICGRE